MKNNSNINTAILLVILVLVVIGLMIVIGNNKFDKLNSTAEENTVHLDDIKSDVVSKEPSENLSFYKKITRSSYSFNAPKDWIDNGQRNFNGCLWDGISNDTSDGMRMTGEIGIYPKSCFNISNASGKKEFSEKNGYYIVAYYDKESGTTASEELETKLAYQKVVDTFSLITAATYTYKNHGFTIELPKGYNPIDQQSEGAPSYYIILPNNSRLGYWTDASWWEKYSLPEYTFLRNEKIGETLFKVYSYGGTTYYWFKQGNVGYEFTGDLELLKTFKFVGWN